MMVRKRASLSPAIKPNLTRNENGKNNDNNNGHAAIQTSMKGRLLALMTWQNIIYADDVNDCSDR